MTVAKIEIARILNLQSKRPTSALVKNTNLVIIKHEKGISVLYGRYHHRGALLSDGPIEVRDIILYATYAVVFSILFHGLTIERLVKKTFR